MSFAKMRTEDFLKELARRTPTPGGGSVAALCGAMGSSLCAMVARITHGKENHRHVWDDMETIIRQQDHLKDAFLELTDADARAYDQVVSANLMPKTTAKERALKDKALFQANKKAAEVPLKTAVLMVKVISCLKVLIAKGNPNCITDVGTAAQLIRAAAHAAAYNVRFNLAAIKDREYVETLLNQLGQVVAKVDEEVAVLEKKVASAINPNKGY
jgi:formiminotetrahydrofolate cyclodeaminase